MSGFTALGDALAGPDRALSYAKGLQYGANTQAALTLARERAQKAQARDGLMDSLASLIPDENERRGVTALIQGDVDPRQVSGYNLQTQERGFRDSAAGVDGSDFATGNRRLMGVATGPVSRFDSAGEGLLQDKLSNEGPGVTRLGDALIDQRTQQARLDEERRLNPDKFRSAGNPFIITPAGPFTKSTDAAGNPVLAPALGPDGKPVPFAAGVADIAGARTAATTTAKQRAIAREALPGRVNDIDTFRTNINTLLAKPGFDTIYGSVAGRAPVQAVTGVVSQDAADAIAARKQLQSQSFGVAIQKMRGLGALSNAEGLKVESALSRAMDPTISPQEARVAFGELQVQLNQLERVAREEAGDASVDEIMGVRTLPSFDTPEAAEAANLPAGTTIMVGGRKAVVE